MSIRTNILTALLLSLMFLPAAAVYSEETKAIDRQWKKALEAYRQDPDSAKTLERLSNFADRWRDTDKFRAARAKYLEASAVYKKKDYNKAYEIFEEVVSSYSKSPYADGAMYKMGECRYNTGDYKGALDIWNKFRFKYNSSMFVMESVYGVVLSYLQMEDFKKAERELTRFLRNNSFYRDDEQIRIAGGLIDYYLENYEDAVEKFKRISSDVAYYYSGHSYMEMGGDNFLKAAGEFKRIGLRFPESKYMESAVYNKAEAFYNAENFSVAAGDYGDYIKKYPSGELAPYAALKKGSSEFETNKFKAARDSFGIVLKGSGDKRVKAYSAYLTGEAFRKEGDNKKALEFYNKVLSDFSDVYDAAASARLRAGWCYANLKQYKKAEDVLNAYINKFTTHEDLPLGYYLLGNANYMQKNYQDAVARYRFLLERFNYSTLSEAALLMMAKSYYEQGRYAMLASEVADSAARMSDRFRDPEAKDLRARTYYYLGQAYFKNEIYSPAVKAFRNIIDNYYESDITAEARGNLAWCYYELENYRAARTMARDILDAKVPGKVKKAAEILIAHTFFSEKDFETAAGKYQEFAYKYADDKDFEHTAEALFQQGRVYEFMEAYGNAIESWNTVVVNYPKSKRAPEALYKKSDIYFKAQEYEEALKGFRALISRWPDDEFAEDAMLSIAEVQYNSGKEKEAVKSYEAFLKKYPDSSKITSVEEGMRRATYVRAEKTEDPELLMEFFEKYPESNLASNALYNSGEIFYRKNMFEKAINAFNKMIEEFPNDSLAVNAHYYIPACYTELERNEDAVRAYKAFLRSYPRHELAPEVMFNLATVLFSTENYSDAIHYYSRLIERYGDSGYGANAIFNSALAYTELGKIDDAIRTYRDFLEKYPEDEKAEGLLAYIAGLYMEQKRYDQALDAFEDVYQEGSPEDKIQAVYSMGTIYGQRDDLQKQTAMFERLVEMKPKKDPYRMNGLVELAGKYEEEQKWADAVRIYEEIIESRAVKEYTEFAKTRIPQIKEAYPEIFAKPETKTETKTED
ncbi:MAG: tetratricopeptide repeat protein [Candidatus Goldiibacteriota bacterium]